MKSLFAENFDIDISSSANYDISVLYIDNLLEESYTLSIDENQILKLIENKKKVFGVRLKDKFGDLGTETKRDIKDLRSVPNIDPDIAIIVLVLIIFFKKK